MSQNQDKNPGTDSVENTSVKPSKAKQGIPKKKNNGTIVSMLVFVLVLAGLYWVIHAYFNIGNNRFTNAAQVEAYINPINTRVSAYIKEIRFIEHQYVKKGDTLLILDDREIQTQLGQAEATYLSALAAKHATTNAVRTASNNIGTAQSNSDAAQANIASAKARLWNAEQNFNRYKNLLKDEAVTRQQFDQVKTEYEASSSALEAVASQYQAIANARGTSVLTVTEVESHLGMNDAEIKRAENALNMAKLNLSYTVITAPHDGIMGRRTINIGQLLSPSQQVATIVDSNNIWITANYREKQMGSVEIGALATIQVDALGGQEFVGKITAISGATGARYAAVPLDNSTGNFVKVQQRLPVRIEFTADNRAEDLKLLRAGMNVEVTLR